MIKLRNLFPRGFFDMKCLRRLENQSKIVRKKKKGYSILGAIIPSVTQLVLKVENGKYFGSVLFSFLKSLLMAATREKTVG